MDTLTAIILGMIQGLTEFLPISSSGHLVIFQHFFNIEEGNLAFDILLHLGSLLAILVVYRKSIISMIIEFFSMLGDLIKTGKLNIYKSKYRKYILLILVASIPAGVIGILFEDIFETIFSNITLVSFTLIITGILLMLGDKIGRSNKKPIENLSNSQGFLIGIFQALAIAPGISRSGSTIVGGLFTGLKKEEATEFSFLISIPAVLGAVLLKSKDILALENAGISSLSLVLGFISASVFGFIAIKLLIRLVNKNKLHYFSYYCWTVSAILIINTLILK